MASIPGEEQVSRPAVAIPGPADMLFSRNLNSTINATRGWV